ncbi:MULTISPECIES: hypothetical protein [unclassified Rhizobacter]|uniref:hypothetical protein n=1 Tax=unclassified Rhizobacter TaxID=2640088 RepID=UPI0006F4B14A|nr:MULTISPECIES: hypothetical protein [unclassified Rhizobacter]KQU73508.1 hypothetical protein ASC88_04670 [Rhizobacter sp. Root29]KQV98693.1 hypothetical protein ASC98_08500 [Rhizobacter sp. Root1238]KRB04947.1 hypothetical protein ASE08_13655 [Rhizobacter sp. Root16D2]
MKRLFFSTAVAVGFLLGCAIARALWGAWTPLCSETCAPSLTLSLYAFSLALPFIWGYVGATVGSPTSSRKRKVTTAVVASAFTAATIVGLTIALHVVPPVNSISG